MSDKILRELERKASTGGIEEKLKYMKECQKQGIRLKDFRENNEKVEEFYDSLRYGKIKVLDNILDHMQFFDPTRSLWIWECTDGRISDIIHIASLPRYERESKGRLKCNLEYYIDKDNILSIPIDYKFTRYEVRIWDVDELINKFIPWVNNITKLKVDQLTVNKDLRKEFSSGSLYFSVEHNHANDSDWFWISFPSSLSHMRDLGASLIPLYLPEGYVHGKGKSS